MLFFIFLDVLTFELLAVKKSYGRAGLGWAGLTESGRFIFLNYNAGSKMAMKIYVNVFRFFKF